VSVCDTNGRQKSGAVEDAYRKVAPRKLVAAPGPDAEGWQLLAEAELGRTLTEAELSTAERLPPPEALDLLFPNLADAARQEALWALAQP
jgi:hypothetical protein